MVEAILCQVEEEANLLVEAVVPFQEEVASSFQVAEVEVPLVVEEDQMEVVAGQKEEEEVAEVSS